MRMDTDDRSPLAHGHRIGIVGHADQANAIARLQSRKGIFAKHALVELPKIDFRVRCQTNGSDFDWDISAVFGPQVCV